MDQAGWQQMAEERIRAANVLLAAHEWASAYYLAGYAVECGLKSCILARLAASPEVIFEDGNKTFSEKCWCHDLDKLVALADLKDALNTDCAADLALQTNWDLAKDWTEASRYRSTPQIDAQALYAAITNPSNGVMKWIRARW